MKSPVLPSQFVNSGSAGLDQGQQGVGGVVPWLAAGQLEDASCRGELHGALTMETFT